jgi:hypothetical protein
MINSYQEEPYVCPVTANPENKIAASYLTEKQGKENNGYHNDHQRHKYDKGIQTVQYPDWRQEDSHVAK